MAEAKRWTMITGASSGIGVELARGFAARGHSLVLTARRRERMDELGIELRARPGIQVEVIVADLERPNAPEALVAELRRRGIALHTLVNNAGFGLRGTFATLPYDGQMGMIELNVTALSKLSRLLLPGMIERGEGGILNVASTAAFQAGPSMAVYYATKAFVLSLSEALHEEVKAKGVTVTALCPGPTVTEFARRADLEKSKLFTAGAMSAVDVARIGIEGYLGGRAVVVTGIANRLGSIGAQLLPRALTRKIAGRLQG
jgi:hypothetical protein